jgi:hypothetical protein
MGCWLRWERFWKIESGTDFFGGTGFGESHSFAPFGAFLFSTALPRLAPLRQAQGRQWAVFFRRFAATSEKRISSRLCRR